MAALLDLQMVLFYRCLTIVCLAILPRAPRPQKGAPALAPFWGAKMRIWAVVCRVRRPQTDVPALAGILHRRSPLIDRAPRPHKRGQFTAA